MPPRKQRPSSAKPVEATVHKNATRKNIPTPELDRFLDKEARKPITLRYPRDPSLDPQLVWKGKDEQDGADLEVQARPIYIQEKIDPRVIIANLRDEQRTKQSQAELFADFNGITFEEQVNFYQHHQNWQNRLILGDSLQVMASLAEKEGLKGQVQCIYMDPPYGIKFGSNWQASTARLDVKDGQIADATRQPEQIKAFRDTWELGIHSYLSYLRDRLTLSRELLADSGSMFVQIGDENLHLVRSVLDEVFGSGNQVATIAFVKTTSQTSDVLPPVFDYILWYARDRITLKHRPSFERKVAEEMVGTYRKLETPDGTIRNLTAAEREDIRQMPAASRLLGLGDMVSQSGSSATQQPFEWAGKTYVPRSGGWKTSAPGLQKLAWANRLAAAGATLLYKRYFDDFPYSPRTNLWVDTQFGGYLRGEEKSYVVQTAARVVTRCVLMATDPGDLVLDPTCGSGTTAYVAEQWGRRWITMDTSRVSLTLARQRLMSAKYPYYILADSVAGRRLGSPSGAEPRNDIRKGFIYKTVPHVMLKSIANNPDIREGMSREEIDRAIARHTDSEVLYDQPVEDGNIVRVTGPFTVESLSPYRAVAPGLTDDGVPTSSLSREPDADGKFEQTILENLRAAGVQNNNKGERIAFQTLEPWPGEYVHAVGEYDDVSGVKRVAVCIGPEHGTVGEQLVREAAKEAAGDFELLVICGYAFEAAVGEDTKRYGALTVLKASINPDLQFGAEILKKRSTDNLFTVFGEPDVAVSVDAGGVTVEVKGLDVYDPTTGDVRNSSPDDIACWFIDTNYNAEAFFVRHAYFTGDRATDPYEQLRKALRAEINDEAWESLYRTTSRPFPKPVTGKIAVKVISHYGDEVMKVYEVT
ncbi:MAG: site-specific DNA-methyltransferase [Candidatus Acidiferrales bacterium]